MRFCLFMTYEADPGTAAGLAQWFESEPRAWLAKQSGLLKADLFAPDPDKALFFDDGAAPAAMVQIDTERLETLEALIWESDFKRLFLDEPLARVSDIWPSFGIFRAIETPVAGQALPQPRTAPMSFVVRYYGPMPDMTAFHDFYVANHMPLLATFPDIRNVYAYLPVAWRNPGLPPSKVLLGNEVVFDSVASLNDALHSDVITALQQDSSQFPPFGHSTHHAMRRRDFL